MERSSLSFLSTEPAIGLIHLLLGVFHLEPISVESSPDSQLQPKTPITQLYQNRTRKISFPILSLKSGWSSSEGVWHAGTAKMLLLFTFWSYLKDQDSKREGRESSWMIRADNTKRGGFLRWGTTVLEIGIQSLEYSNVIFICLLRKEWYEQLLYDEMPYHFVEWNSRKWIT